VSRHVHFLTDAEMVIDPTVPTPKWGLKASGQNRYMMCERATPIASVRGREYATAAQARIVAAPRADASEAQKCDVAILPHGGIGILLGCFPRGRAITQNEGQPHPKAGGWLAFDRRPFSAPTDWNAI